MSKTQDGYLLIADISGYTMYLSESELEHAQGTLTALLNLLVEHTPPPLVISHLEGDAVISYGLSEHFFQGQTFIEIIEDTYVAFRKAIERMVLNNTCQCNACANIPNLDLKFFLHFGTFAIQRIRERDELVGSDVILIHRLLKNHVQETTGLHAYSLYTEAAIDQLGLESLCETMIAHTEIYEHLEEVKVWVQDMHAVWERKRGVSQVTIPADRIKLEREFEFDVPPELLWDYLNTPEHRNTLNGSDRYEIINKKDGRTAPGSIYQCYHGNETITQTLLEWQPFKRMLLQQLVAIPVRNTTILIEYQLDQLDSGTRLTQRVSKPEGPMIGRLMVNMMLPSISKFATKSIGAFKQQVEEQWKADNHMLDLKTGLTIEEIREAANTSLTG